MLLFSSSDIYINNIHFDKMNINLRNLFLFWIQLMIIHHSQFLLHKENNTKPRAKTHHSLKIGVCLKLFDELILFYFEQCVHWSNQLMSIQKYASDASAWMKKHVTYCSEPYHSSFQFWRKTWVYEFLYMIACLIWKRFLVICFWNKIIYWRLRFLNEHTN